MKCRNVIEELVRVKKGRNVSMEVKKGLKNSILLPTLMYGSDTGMWNMAQQPKVCATKISYLRRACGVKGWDGESDEGMHEKCGMGTCKLSMK